MRSKFKFSPGSTLYLPCDLMFEDPHLWVILTSPFNDPPVIIMAMLTTKKSYSDTTVELNIGDHPFITHPTVVSYMDANCFKVDELEKGIKSGMVKPNEPFTRPVLEKIKVVCLGQDILLKVLKISVIICSALIQKWKMERKKNKTILGQGQKDINNQYLKTLYKRPRCVRT